jgi:hypothetical protein
MRTKPAPFAKPRPGSLAQEWGAIAEKTEARASCAAAHANVIRGRIPVGAGGSAAAGSIQALPIIPDNI